MVSRARIEQGRVGAPARGRRVRAEPVGGDQVVERPDGTWWVTSDEGREVGPFASRAEALEAQASGVDESLYEPGESVEEAKSEIGISEWIDPDTGEPAEEDMTRLEDH
jgi:hypothetical protein